MKLLTNKNSTSAHRARVNYLRKHGFTIIFNEEFTPVKNYTKTRTILQKRIDGVIIEQTSETREYNTGTSTRMYTYNQSPVLKFDHGLTIGINFTDLQIALDRFL